MSVRTHHQPGAGSAHLYFPRPPQDLPARQSHSPRRLLQRKVQGLTISCPTMIVVVQQRVFTFSSEYEIETPACFYSAKKKSFLRSHKIRLFAPRSRLLATIGGNFIFRPTYDIKIAVERSTIFGAKSFGRVSSPARTAKSLFVFISTRGSTIQSFKRIPR
jgi:hypothetical protein